MFAALTVAIMLVPQGMAYAMLAGMPPIYGLYASFIPLIIYPLFGSSRFLSVGPVALVSIIMLSGLSTMAVPGSMEYIQLAILTSFIAGLIQVLLALLRMGWLVNYLSEPVIIGFTSAAAIIITISQLSSFLGISIPRANTTVETISNLFNNLGSMNMISLGIGAGSLLLILGLKRIKKTLPGALIAVLIGTLIVYYMQLNNQGVAIVGQVPSGLPSFSYDFFSMDSVVKVLPLAVVICLISFIESLAIAKSLAARNDDSRIDSNKELMGLGLAKAVGSLFQAFPNTGSFSRSAVAEQSGGVTGFSSILTAIFIGLTLLFLTPLFEFLPKPVLAAIIISAVTGLINFPYAKKLFLLDRKDFYVLIVTFVLTLLLGVQNGVLAGVLLSIVMILYKSSKPHYAVLARLKGTNAFRNQARYKDAESIEGTLIIRYDDDLYFGNAEHWYDSILKEVDNEGNIENLILDFSSINNIDSTAFEKLELLLRRLEAKDIRLIFSGVIGPMRDFLEKSGFYERMGKQNNYLTIAEAVDGICGSKTHEFNKLYATQSYTKRKF